MSAPLPISKGTWMLALQGSDENNNIWATPLRNQIITSDSEIVKVVYKGSLKMVSAQMPTTSRNYQIQNWDDFGSPEFPVAPPLRSLEIQANVKIIGLAMAVMDFNY